MRLYGHRARFAFYLVFHSNLSSSSVCISFFVCCCCSVISYIFRCATVVHASMDFISMQLCKTISTVDSLCMRKMYIHFTKRAPILRYSGHANCDLFGAGGKRQWRSKNVTKSVPLISFCLLQCFSVLATNVWAHVKGTKSDQKQYDKKCRQHRDSRTRTEHFFFSRNRSISNSSSLHSAEAWACDHNTW